MVQAYSPTSAVVRLRGILGLLRARSERSSSRNWHYLESVAAPIVVVGLLLCNAVIELSIVGVLHADVIASRIQVAILDATYVVGVLALVATFWRERGVERSRVGWIIAGFTIAFAARGGESFSDLYGPLFVPGVSSWQQLVPRSTSGRDPDLPSFMRSCVTTR